MVTCSHVHAFGDRLKHALTSADDLVVLAGALGLKTVGTVSKLVTIIKSHLSQNSNLQFNPRFAGLFLQNIVWTITVALHRFAC